MIYYDQKIKIKNELKIGALLKGANLNHLSKYLGVVPLRRASSLSQLNLWIPLSISSRSPLCFSFMLLHSSTVKYAQSLSPPLAIILNFLSLIQSSYSTRNLLTSTQCALCSAIFQFHFLSPVFLILSFEASSISSILI